MAANLQTILRKFYFYLSWYMKMFTTKYVFAFDLKDIYNKLNTFWKKNVNIFQTRVIEAQWNVCSQHCCDCVSPFCTREKHHNFSKRLQRDILRSFRHNGKRNIFSMITTEMLFKISSRNTNTKLKMYQVYFSRSLLLIRCEIITLNWSVKARTFGI